MTWYAASLVKVVLLKSGEQDEFPVYETIFLIEAKSLDEANDKANKLGKLECEADAELYYNDVPAYSKFLGVRKIKKTHNLLHDEEIGSAIPVDGTELSTSYYEIYDKADLQRFAEGKRVTVSYVDDDD